LPPAADYFARSFFPGTPFAGVLHDATMLSPFSAAFALPLEMSGLMKHTRLADTPIFVGHVAVQLLVMAVLLRLMMRVFRNRYDAAGGI